MRLTMIGSSERGHLAEYFFNAVRNPGFGKPVWRRNPPGYSITAGCAAGRRGRSEIGFVTNAPNESRPPRSLRPRRSGANPNDPAAFINGLLKCRSRFMAKFYPSLSGGVL